MSNTSGLDFEWAKSSYSSGDGGQCVEWAPKFAAATGKVPIRDSKVPGGPVLLVSATAWTGFLASAQFQG
ncbi:DUF397 domain-containing protein [Streptomyces sp. NPDC006692]|uniref:DUF397 domain-containing protein n=1 Tax=Streptomyces sp. NPDC006692 TaxID=3364758 RepID=UPI00368D2C11